MKIFLAGTYGVNGDTAMRSRFQSVARSSAAVAAVAAFLLLTPSKASAIQILGFGQVGGVNTIVGTNNNAGSTTIAGNGVAVTVTNIDAGVSTPLAAFLTLSATNTDAAVDLAPGPAVVVNQHYNGTFTITENADGSGTNYLSGSFRDALLGFGNAITLLASTPGVTDVLYTSDVIPSTDLGLDRALGFSLSNVIPTVNIVNGSLASFNGSVTGTFSANIGNEDTTVPEPASMLLLGTGLVGLGSRLRRSKKA